MPDPGTASALAWLERASLPVSQLSDPEVIRAALNGLCARLDGSPAAANTISRKRAAFHGALGYAVELGLLPANPLGLVHWHAPRAATAVNPATVASPAQVRAILDQAARIRPELAAFFGCLYYAALRPEEAVALRRDDLILPAHGRGTIILTAACPRTGTAWTSTGTPHEPRGLKHRADGAIRVVPIPPVMARMLRHHLRQFGTAPDGRLFPGTRGGMLSESVYGRAWHAARHAALSPELAAVNAHTASASTNSRGCQRPSGERGSGTRASQSRRHGHGAPSGARTADSSSRATLISEDSSVGTVLSGGLEGWYLRSSGAVHARQTGHPASEAPPAPPGTSSHHTGTNVNLAGAVPSWQV